MFKEALVSYREALRLWGPILSVHVFVRLVISAILVPVIGLLLAVTLSFSDQTALTDQDIARFLLTPAGAIGALVVASLTIVAVLVDVTTMTAILRSQARTPLEALTSALTFLMQALPRLLIFAGHLLVRVLALSIPFLAVGAGVAALLLREYDINYYLATQPFAFKVALGFGGLCLACLALLLLERFTAWAIALNVSVFDKVPARRAFDLSRDRMQGYRRALLRRVVAWFALRFALASAVVLVMGFLLAEAPLLVADRMRLFFGVTAILLVLWAVLNAMVSALANGALSDILNEEFDRYLEARPARHDTKRARSRVTTLAVFAVVSLLSLGSVMTGGFLSNQIGGVAKVEVIAHRGASGARPENTMAAVEKAVEDGADWVEIDVQETADGEVLVVHDSDFMKSAGVPLKIWDATMEDIAQIDIGTWFDPAFADERPPLLRDVLDTVKDRSKLLIELKYYGYDVDLENRVIALVEAADMQDQVATMSLKYPAVQKMLELRPEWRSGVLAATAIGDTSGLQGDFIAMSAGRVSGRVLVQAEAAGKDVYVWTVNDQALMSRMISLGVDGLITDEPKLAREVIGYYQTLTTPERVMLRLGDTIGFTFDLTPVEEVEP